MGLLEMLLRSMLIWRLVGLACAQETTSTTNIVFVPPSNCSRNCGNIRIEYPFGIGNGCFRSAGFNLTCINNHTTNIPRLFLSDSNIEVKEIDMERGVVLIEPPIITMDVDQENQSTSYIDIKDWPFSLDLKNILMDGTNSLTSNSLYVTGCSATVIVVDSLTNIAMDVCSTICSTKNVSSENGYCSLDTDDWKKKNLTSLEIQLTRLNRPDLHLINTSSIKVVMYDTYNVSAEDFQAIMRGDKTGLTASLAWYMKDDNRSCKEAKKNNKTYACTSQNSDCYDALPGFWASSNDPIGYVCQCIKGYHGNPYQPDGCQDTTYKPIPTKDCATKCGTVDVPYPFGLNESCYRDESFALQCNETSNPPTLLFQNYYIVSNISLEEGQLQLKDANTYYYQPSSTPFISSPEHRTINWVITNRHCEDAKKNRTTFACVSPLSTCVDATMSSTSSSYLGYRCQCKKGYEGNPYLSDGCQDIDECTLPQIYTCNGICNNTDGNYSCTCPLGTSGDPKHGVCINIPDKKKTLLLGVIVGASTGISLLLLSIMLVILIRKWKKTNQKKVREKHFRQNHGLLLQQLISSSKNVAERTQIFSLAEIEKATNNFDETRILGQGGHGTVYKGILSDQCIVAIKRSKNVKKTEIDQFINEVAILSQINHRHVVKLFGCCLETEVPLLIYEFISNGTLSEHLHNSNGESRLSWDDRLRIATEAAGALSYLHSTASISIFHRDVKSSNILLDDNFTTKVSDFGASRCIPLDQTHLVTAIQGTFGYLDLEYYQTSQLTEKSDVYSFGVILLELLTGKKPIYSSRDEKDLNLAMHFLQAKKDNQFFDLVEDCVMKEGSEEELIEIIQLIEMCIRLKGVERPTMKDVEYKLQGLRRTRAKKNKGYINAETNEEESDSLLCPSSYVELIDQAYQGTSRIYSMENELMLSQKYPR